MRVGLFRALALTLFVSTVLVSVGQAQAAPVRAPSTSPTKPYVGDVVTISGRVSTKFRRTVRLQRWSSKGYVTRKTTTTDSMGRYRFTQTAAASSQAFRVHAPALTRSKKRYASIVTSSTRVKGRAHSASLTIPAVVRPGTTFTAKISITRALAGRTVRLQKRSGSSWTSVATGKTSTRGGVWLRTSAGSLGSASYRAVVSSAGSRPSITSPTRTHQVERIPVATLRITTNDGSPIDSREDYDRARMVLDPMDSGLPAFDVPTRIRLRGNSTSWISVKPPFKIKLDTKTALAGMPANKDWGLLANFYDRSLLRNTAGFEVARRIGMPWSARMQPVEVTVNGKFYGLYDLAETVAEGSERVDLPKGGVLLEADSWADDDPHFRTDQGLQVFLKDPDDEDQAFTDDVAAQVQVAEDSLYAEDFLDPETGYRAHFDVDSFIDWYLTNELMKNLDSNFNNSLWMSLVDGRVAMAAPWDFDQSSGNRRGVDVEKPTDWFLGRNWITEGFDLSQIDDPRGHWLIRMLADPWFQEKVAARWREVSPAVHGVPAYVAARAEMVSGAADRNFAPVASGGAGQPLTLTFMEQADSTVLKGSWVAEVAHLEGWLTARIAWLDQQYAASQP